MSSEKVDAGGGIICVPQTFLVVFLVLLSAAVKYNVNAHSIVRTAAFAVSLSSGCFNINFT